MDLESFRSKVEEHGGFENIRFSPHMRFRAGQRRLKWDKITSKIRNGEIDEVQENTNPNNSIPYQHAYLIFITVEEKTLTIPFYILQNGGMKAVTVMRK